MCQLMSSIYKLWETFIGHMVIWNQVFITITCTHSNLSNKIHRLSVRPSVNPFVPSTVCPAVHYYTHLFFFKFYLFKSRFLEQLLVLVHYMLCTVKICIAVVSWCRSHGVDCSHYWRGWFFFKQEYRFIDKLFKNIVVKKIYI